MLLPSQTHKGGKGGQNDTTQHQQPPHRLSRAIELYNPSLLWIFLAGQPVGFLGAGATLLVDVVSEYVRRKGLVLLSVLIKFA